MQPVITNMFSVVAQKNGVDAYIIDLTNQMNSVPVDANGKVTFATDLSTTARIIKGADYVREGIGVPAAADLKVGSVTPTVVNDGGLVTITWKFKVGDTLTSERYVKTVRMTHDGKVYSADYTIRTDKSGAIYDLLPSLTEVPFVRDENYNLIPSAMRVYCGYTKNQNGTITSYNGKTASHLSNIDSKYYIYYRWVNADGSFGSWDNVTTSGIEVKNSDTYAGIEFVFSSATAKGSVADGNIIDRETVPIVRQSERGFGIVCSVQRDNFTEAQWNTDPGYGVIGHQDTWSDTSSIRNGARKGDLFTVVGTATDTRNGHTATYRCTNASGNLQGICIAHAISKAGDDSILLDLDNQSDLISCHDDGKVRFARTITTKARMTKGARQLAKTEITAPAVDAIKLAGKNADSVSVADDGTITIQWKFAVTDKLTSSNYEVQIPVKYGSDITRYAKFTLGVTNDNSIYQLVPTHNAVSFVRQNDNSLSPSTMAVSCGYVKITADGVSAVSAYTKAATQGIDGKYSIFYRYVKSDGTFTDWTLPTTNTTITIYSSTTNAALEYALSSASAGADVADGNIIDRETIPINKDGASPVFGDLTNDADLFGTDSNGLIVEDQYRSTVAHIFVGSKKQTLTENPTVSLKYASSGNAVSTDVAEATTKSGKDTTEGNVTIMLKANKTVTDAIYADITVKSGAGNTTIRFTLKPVKSGEPGKNPEIWQLAPDHDSLSFERNADNTLSPDSITMYVYASKTEGQTTERKTSAVDGLKVYWGWDEAGASGNKAIGSSWSITKAEAAEHRQIWFELRSSKDNYVAWIDRETIPINKDGENGAPGGTGNGIKAVTYYRMFTMNFSAPLSSDSGWIKEGNSSYPTIEGLTDKTKNFLWQKKVTTYTNTSDVDTEISLLAQKDNGVKENLLEDTAFNSLAEMEAWSVKSLYNNVTGQETPAESGAGVVTTGTGGHNAYYDKTAYGSTKLLNKEVLQQIVWQNATGGIKKLETTEWYTFSFWAKGTSYSRLHTYIYPTSVYQSADFYVDGVKQSTVPADGHVEWTLTGSWVRHTVTFRTKGSFYDSTNSNYPDQKVLFRLTPYGENGSSSNTCYICMPKLERNTMASEWVESANDRIADDIQHVFVGNWAQYTTYYYGGGTGVRHVVRAKKSATGAMTYFRMKKRTTSAGYYSTKEPYNDTEYWEQADYLKFVATDFLLAEEIETDKLTVTKIRGKDNCFVVDASGNVTANKGTFNNITTNNLKINSGTIGGFTIDTYGITNQSDESNFNKDSYIIIRNDTRKCFVGIGGNVTPSYSTMKALGRFEIEDSTADSIWGGYNTALILRAKNGGSNSFAFCGCGNGTLDGWIGGYKFSKYTLTSANTIMNGAITFKENNTWIVKANVDGAGVELPRLSAVRTALGLGSTTDFCIRLLIHHDVKSSYAFRIYGRNTNQNSSGSKPWNTDQLPLIFHWDNNNWDYVDMGQGDTCEFLLIYENSRSDKHGDYTMKYTARIINRQD